MRDVTLHRLEEVNSKLVDSDKVKSQTERDLRTFVESELEKQKIYVDHGVDSVRKLQEIESEKIRGRIVEHAENFNQIESAIAEVKSNVNSDLQKIMQEADSREKVFINLNQLKIMYVF